MRLSGSFRQSLNAVHCKKCMPDMLQIRTAAILLLRRSKVILTASSDPI
jgi:hypothetical protein